MSDDYLDEHDPIEHDPIVAASEAHRAHLTRSGPPASHGDTFVQAVALIRQQVGARHAEALFQGGAGEWLEGRAFLAALDATPNPEPPIGDP